MNFQKAKTLSKKLNGFACKGCTEGWLEEHDDLTDPIEDIKDCAALGLITLQLQEKLVDEVHEIKSRN